MKDREPDEALLAQFMIQYINNHGADKLLELINEILEENN